MRMKENKNQANNNIGEMHISSVQKVQEKRKLTEAKKNVRVLLHKFVWIIGIKCVNI